MTNSHAAGRKPDEPTAAQLKELFAQTQSGRVTKQLLQRFLRECGSTASLSTARKIMGSNSVFGPAEWNRFLGDKFQINNIPKIPYYPSQLESPAIPQKHFLFLGLEKLGDEPLDLNGWRKLLKGRNLPNFREEWDWFFNQPFAKKTCKTRWYLMTDGIVPNSNNLSLVEQTALLPEEYKIPNVIECLTAKALYCLLNGNYMDVFWARTSDEPDYGGCANVHGAVSQTGGLCVYDSYKNASSFIGVIALMKA